MWQRPKQTARGRFQTTVFAHPDTALQTDMAKPAQFDYAPRQRR